MEKVDILAVKEYNDYNNKYSGRTEEEKNQVIEIANKMEKSCMKCAHFTTVSQVDNGKCHVHYNRHDVHDVCDRFETSKEFIERCFGKKDKQ